MSTDSTELTFVRCPSCRSLVPAVSTRCRMCGASLDTEADMQGEESPAQEEPSGRVRQRTMSKSKSDLSSTAEQIRDEIVAAEDAFEAEEEGVEQESMEMESEYDDGPLDDPLSGYLEEIDEAPEPVQDASAKEQEAPEAMKPARNGNGAKSQEQPKPSVRIETGTKRGGLSFNKQEPAPKQEKPLQPEPVQEAQSRVNEEVVEEVQEDFIEPEPTPAPKKSTPKKSKPEPQAKEPVKEAPQAKPARGALAAKAPQHGRLFGWLVSYTNPEGEAVELREGRFFVTGSSLKETDMVLDHESISTPHALVSISERGFEVQDLMSERGVHVRGKDEDTYQREEEVVTLEHGDWLRLGDVEFLVTLIAHVGKS